MNDLDVVIKKIICEQLGVSIDSIQNEKSISKDFKADSLDKVSLLVAIEEKLQIQISDQQAKNIQTVGDIISAARALTEKK